MEHMVGLRRDYCPTKHPHQTSLLSSAHYSYVLYCKPIRLILYTLVLVQQCS